MPRPRLRFGWSYGPRIGYDRYLSPGEEVAFEVRRHAAALLAPVIQALGAWILLFLIHNWLDLPSETNPIDSILFIVVMAFTLRAIWRWFEWQIERVLVTNKRIVEVSGIITRRVASMPLAKVTDLTYKRGPIARLFNYGELILESAGQKQALESISYIPRPDEFYRDFTELLNNAPLGQSSPDDKDTGEIPRPALGFGEAPLRLAERTAWTPALRASKSLGFGEAPLRLAERKAWNPPFRRASL